MAIFNPVYALVIPTLCLVTVPLAILAGITTTFAFSVLIIRVLIVYVDIALSLVPQSLSSLTTRSLPSSLITAPTTPPALISPSPLRRQQYHHQQQQQQQHLQQQQQQQSQLGYHHRRRRSSASGFSGGSASSISERGLGLIPSVGPERDFEGIGGWRVGGAEEDELWTTVNPRIETPAERSSYPRHHLRTPSGHTTPGEGGYLMMKGRTRSPDRQAAYAAAKTPTSPNSSRARTPTGPKMTFTPGPGVGVPLGGADGYFALSRNTSPKAKKRHLA